MQVISKWLCYPASSSLWFVTSCISFTFFLASVGNDSYHLSTIIELLSLRIYYWCKTRGGRPNYERFTFYWSYHVKNGARFYLLTQQFFLGLFCPRGKCAMTLTLFEEPMQPKGQTTTPATRSKLTTEDLSCIVHLSVLENWPKFAFMWVLANEIPGARGVSCLAMKLRSVLEPRAPLEGMLFFGLTKTNKLTSVN